MSEVENLIDRTRQLDDAWTGGALDRMATLLHADVVMLAGDGAVVVQGRQALVQTYADFLARVEVRDFEAEPPWVHVVGDTAVVRYRFTIAWAESGTELVEQGSETLTWARVGGRWQVMCRQRGY